MEFLSQQNDRVAGNKIDPKVEISAKGKNVLVIGGGDTGSDCVGTSNRQGAKSVTQLELLDQPPEKENKALTWPDWPLNCVKVEWSKDDNGRMKMSEVTGTEFSFEADLVLLAMGFVHPIHEGLINSLGGNLTPVGNLDANDTEFKTSIDKFFAAGDSRRGQSLVVWAIREGRQCARSIDKFLMGKSELPN